MRLNNNSSSSSLTYYYVYTDHLGSMLSSMFYAPLTYNAGNYYAYGGMFVPHNQLDNFINYQQTNITRPNGTSYAIEVYDWYKKYANGKMEYEDTQYKNIETGNSFFIDIGNATACNGCSDNGNIINTLQSRNNTVFLGDDGDNNIFKFYKFISSYNIKNQITIIGHGNWDRFGVDLPNGTHKVIRQAATFNEFMSNYTTLWNQRENIPLTVWSFACYTALPSDGLNPIPILQMLSGVYTNVTFIGPSSGTSFNYLGLFSGISNNGVWNVYRGGRQIGSFNP